MKLRARIGLGVAAALVAYPTVGWVAAMALTRRPHPRFEEPAPAGHEAIWLRAEDGVGIGGWYRPASGAGPTVVLAHGNGASRTQMRDTSDAMAALGCAALPISLRAHGDSDGDRNDVGLSARRDVIAAVREARRRRPDAPVLLYGSSLGAAASVFAGGELGDEVAGYVLVGPFADLRDAVRRRTERYLWPGVDALAYGALLAGGRLALPELDRIRPEHAARRISRRARALLIAGGDDDRAPPSDARRIARALSHARVVRADGLRHEDLGALPHHEAWGEVARFVRSFE